MVKRLIFDLDDTLIRWDDSYINAIKETVIEYNVNIDYLKLNDLVENYEQYYNTYSKENMLELFNKKLNLNLDMSFMNSWLDKLGSMAMKDDSVIDTIKYLSDKYSLVVLTNFMSSLQISRLKTAGIYEYFDDVIGGERFIKPNIESFKNAIGKYNSSECLMIGDNIDIDIKGALNAGLDVILIDYNDKYQNTEYKRIKNITDLKEML